VRLTSLDRDLYRVEFLHSNNDRARCSVLSDMVIWWFCKRSDPVQPSALAWQQNRSGSGPAWRIATRYSRDCATPDALLDTRTLQAFMGDRSIANTVIYTAVADKRIRNIWGK
jgi:hypothetical protein